MKITNIRAIQPIAANSPPDWRTTLGQILIAIDTDAGLTGYGVGGGGAAGMHVVQTVLRDYLLGADPEQIEEHWLRMYDATLPFGRKGIAIMALSGVDLALWDLRGKQNNAAVVKLLGGTSGEPIPTYGTFWGEIDTTQVDNLSAFKLHLRNGTVADVIPALQKAREIIGFQAPLMVDGWMKWDVENTLQIAEASQPYQLDWIEEPIPIDDRAGYASLRDASPVPIAGGEHEFTARGFQPLIEQKLHTIIQPDVCWCGGLTQLIEIYRQAQQAGLRVCQHRGCEVWGLHAVAALDVNPLAESGRPWMTWVLDQPEIENGFITISDRPGFGIRIDEAQLP